MRNQRALQKGSAKQFCVLCFAGLLLPPPRACEKIPASKKKDGAGLPTRANVERKKWVQIGGNMQADILDMAAAPGPGEHLKPSGHLGHTNPDATVKRTMDSSSQGLIVGVLAGCCASTKYSGRKAVTESPSCVVCLEERKGSVPQTTYCPQGRAGATLGLSQNGLPQKRLAGNHFVPSGLGVLCS